MVREPVVSRVIQNWVYTTRLKSSAMRLPRSGKSTTLAKKLTARTARKPKDLPASPEN